MFNVMNFVLHSELFLRNLLVFDFVSSEREWTVGHQSEISLADLM
jgi:hypothetical protein